jgi:hypothetical protein
VTSAGAAFRPLGRLLPGGAPLALLRPAYRLVADRRSLLGKLIPERAKKRADARVARRRSRG